MPQGMRLMPSITLRKDSTSQPTGVAGSRKISLGNGDGWVLEEKGRPARRLSDCHFYEKWAAHTQPPDRTVMSSRS